jgi:hypothetical protein
MRVQQQKKLENDVLDNFVFHEENRSKLGTISGFIEQNIGLYHPTPEERAKYGLPENADRLADNDIIELIEHGHHKQVFRYIFDKLREMPQEVYEVRTGVPVRKKDIHLALLELLKLLQYPEKTYETYDYPRLFTDTLFRKTWVSYVRFIQMGRNDALACPGDIERRWNADQIRVVPIRPDNHCLYRAMAVFLGLLAPDKGMTDDDETREAVRAVRDYIATEIERGYALKTQQQKANQRSRMYHDLRPALRARIDPQGIGYQNARTVLQHYQDFSRQQKQQVLRYMSDHDAQDQKTYTRQIRQTQRWGGELEIVAFARLVGPRLCVVVVDRRADAARPVFHAYGSADAGRSFVLVRTDDVHYDIGLCERSFRQQLQRALKTSRQLPARLRRTAQTMERSRELLLQLLRQRKTLGSAVPPPAAAAGLPPIFVPAWPMLPPPHDDGDGFYGDPDFAEF